jgi:hypothetical protein
MKKILLFLMLFLASFTLFSCNKTKQSQKDNSKTNTLVRYALKDVYAKDIPEDSLDIVINLDSLKAQGYDAIPLSDKDFVLSKALLHAKFNAERKSIEAKKDEFNPTPLPFREYFRQYWAYKKRGHTYVHIELAAECPVSYKTPNPDKTTLMTLALKGLRNSELCVDDGGVCFGSALIDLTMKKVIYLRFNGVA